MSSSVCLIKNYFYKKCLTTIISIKNQTLSLQPTEVRFGMVWYKSTLKLTLTSRHFSRRISNSSHPDLDLPDIGGGLLVVW